MIVMIYYNVYTKYGKWIGRYAYECQAGKIAKNIDGFYIKTEW